MKRLALVGVVLALIACSSSREGGDGSRADAAAPPDARMPGDADLGICTAPAETMVSCEPLPAGAEGCPADTLAFGAVPGATDATYPVGCQVRFPFCLDAYPTFTAECTCQSNAGREPQWWCPI